MSMLQEQVFRPGDTATGVIKVVNTGDRPKTFAIELTQGKSLPFIGFTSERVPLTLLTPPVPPGRETTIRIPFALSQQEGSKIFRVRVGEAGPTGQIVRELDVETFSNLARVSLPIGLEAPLPGEALITTRISLPEDLVGVLINPAIATSQPYAPAVQVNNLGIPGVGQSLTVTRVGVLAIWPTGKDVLGNAFRDSRTIPPGGSTIVTLGELPVPSQIPGGQITYQINITTNELGVLQFTGPLTVVADGIIPALVAPIIPSAELAALENTFQQALTISQDSVSRQLETSSQQIAGDPSGARAVGLVDIRQSYNSQIAAAQSEFVAAIASGDIREAQSWIQEVANITSRTLFLIQDFISQGASVPTALQTRIGNLTAMGSFSSPSVKQGDSVSWSAIVRNPTSFDIRSSVGVSLVDAFGGEIVPLVSPSVLSIADTSQTPLNGTLDTRGIIPGSYGIRVTGTDPITNTLILDQVIPGLLTVDPSIVFEVVEPLAQPAISPGLAPIVPLAPITEEGDIGLEQGDLTLVTQAPGAPIQVFEDGRTPVFRVEFRRSERQLPTEPRTITIQPFQVENFSGGVITDLGARSLSIGPGEVAGIDVQWDVPTGTPRQGYGLSIGVFDRSTVSRGFLVSQVIFPVWEVIALSEVQQGEELL